MKKITIIGDGGWGSALAIALANNGHNVHVWGPFPDYIAEIKATKRNPKFLPGITIPANITWHSDPQESCHHADIAVLVVPSRHYRQVCTLFAPHLPPNTILLSATKGLDPQSGERMTQVAANIFAKNHHIAVLSGPSHAEEVAQFIPTAVVVACPEKDTASLLQRTFASRALRVYTASDVIGVEFGGAMKNVIAIAAGACDGIGFGDNTKAALITRGLAEIARLGVAAGAHAQTFAGLSGLGDLVVTCMSKHSRNRHVGERLGHGETIDHIIKSMEQVAEGVWTCPTARKLAQELNVPVPITDAVYAVLHEGKSPLAAVNDLMSRDLVPEHY